MHDALDGKGKQTNWCVITGGEPALQIDDGLVRALRGDGWHIAVETNGTVDNDALRTCDHICISPKRGTAWTTLGLAHELKVVLPGAVSGELGWSDAELEQIEAAAEKASPRPQLFVQPQDPVVDPSFVEQTFLKHAGSDPSRVDLVARTYQAHLDQCIAWVLAHEKWRLSAQLHKYVGLA